jgi:C4-dicarboxylate-specific signal transduction histidine kinase
MATARAPLPLVRVSTPVTLDGLRRMLQHRADEAGVHLSWAVDPAVAARGPLDELQWTQVALPLCDNAFDVLVAPDAEGERRECRLDVVLLPANPGGGDLIVRDDGPGCQELAAAAAGRLRRVGGGHLGLGLAVAAALVERHGGSLEIQAVEPHGFVAHASVPAGRLA